MCELMIQLLEKKTCHHATYANVSRVLWTRSIYSFSIKVSMACKERKKKLCGKNLWNQNTQFYSTFLMSGILGVNLGESCVITS